MSAYTTDTLKDFQDINPDIAQVSMPKDLTQIFANAAIVNPGQGLDVSGIEAQNRGREFVANEGMKEIRQSVEVLDETIKQIEPEEPAAANISGRVAAVGISLATGGLATAGVAAIAGPVAAASFAGLGSLATFKDIAGIARDAFSGGGENDRQASQEADEFKSSGPVEHTFEHAARNVTAMQPFGAPRDIAAFKGAMRHNAQGSDGIAERAEISEQSLEGIKALKMNLEDQMYVRDRSMQNVADVRGMLTERMEKGVAVPQTQEVAHAQGYKPPENEMPGRGGLSFNA